MNNLYVVLTISTKQTVKAVGCSPPLEQEIDLVFADGMVGALPVFSSKESAEKYANGADIQEIQEIQSD